MQPAVEATKVVVQAMAVEGAGPRSEAISKGPILGGPSLKYKSFSWNKQTNIQHLEI